MNTLATWSFAISTRNSWYWICLSASKSSLLLYSNLDLQLRKQSIKWLIVCLPTEPLWIRGGRNLLMLALCLTTLSEAVRPHKACVVEKKNHPGNRAEVFICETFPTRLPRSQLIKPSNQYNRAKRANSANEPARPLVRTHRNFRKVISGVARCRKPGQSAQASSCEDTLNGAIASGQM